jgi:hypothetical protein
MKDSGPQSSKGPSRRDVAGNLVQAGVLVGGAAVLTPFGIDAYQAYKEHNPTPEEIALKERELIDIHNRLNERYKGVAIGVHVNDEHIAQSRKEFGDNQLRIFALQNVNHKLEAYRSIEKALLSFPPEFVRAECKTILVVSQISTTQEPHSLGFALPESRLIVATRHVQPLKTVTRLLAGELFDTTMSTVRHEVVHALTMSVTEAEWATLIGHLPLYHGIFNNGLGPRPDGFGRAHARRNHREDIAITAEYALRARKELPKELANDAVFMKKFDAVRLLLERITQGKLSAAHWSHIDAGQDTTEAYWKV